MNKLILLFSLLVIASSGSAKVTATVDRNQIVIGETFNLVISTDENTHEQPDLSELSEVFRILGNSQSSSTRIINGKYSVEKTWQISLMPNGVGNNTIPPIKLGNQSTRAISIKVTKSDPNAKANGDLFVEIQADKKSAFVKEQIILTVKLFYAISLSEGNLSEPIASNTIVTQLDKGATYTTNRDGKNYTVVERHYALFAEKSGQLELNPIIFNGRDNSSRRSFSMFSTGKPMRAISKALTLEIKPIPQTSIGKDWIPAKKVNISQEWSKGPYTVGEPITRTITLYAEGLSETQIPDIDLGEINNIRIYPEQPQTQTEKTASSLKAWKQMKIAMIPTQAGAIRVPEFNLEWYNTVTGKIEHAKLPPLTLQVDAGDFGVKKPDIGDLFAQERNDSGKPSNVSQKIPEKEIQIIEKDNVLWKYLSALFATLWLFTTLLYLRKNNKKVQSDTKQKTIKIDKKQILYSIESENTAELQTVLINWWNSQYPKYQVTNLTQIKLYVNSDMQKLIDDLEVQLYDTNKASSFDKEKWRKQVKGNGLRKVINKNKVNNTQLPDLY
ncbi:MAG: BatD family protein [Proteobacteria bacterium]|nr:BatD family protein [Pseudomonadota bacterium]